MIMGPRLRKAALTTHVCSSVGWLGAIAAFLPIAVAGNAGHDAQLVRAASMAMTWTGWYVLVPLSFASLLTGLLQSLGSVWGLFRHYWVLAKLLINILANVMLVMFMQVLSSTGYGDSNAPVLHAVIAFVLLLVATVISIYKPSGITPYGWRKQHMRRAQEAPLGTLADARPS
jgi:hypothetical protein